MAQERPGIRTDVSSTLETCRLEVVRRLQAKSLPLSIQVEQSAVNETGQGNGISFDTEIVPMSGLNAIGSPMAIRSPGYSGLQLVDLDSQLVPLAKQLDRETDLGSRQSHSFPDMAGVEAILARYLYPMTVHYLTHVTDLAMPNHDLLEQMTEELDRLAAANGTVTSVTQLLISGLAPVANLQYRGVTLRQLTPQERGAVVSTKPFDLSVRLISDSDFVAPHFGHIFVPSTLIRIETRRPWDRQQDQSTLGNRLALAFFLKGFTLSSNLPVIAFDLPTWSRMVTSFPTSLVAEKAGGIDQALSEDDFESIVDLAYKMPEFSGTEGSSQEIALFRVLRGCGLNWRESGLLDFAIALEAALLGKSGTELAFKFSLYGALFLRDAREPQQTFKALKNIYSMRSTLVHGGKVKEQQRHSAEQDARDLAMAVVHKSIVSGWPNKDVLDQAAVSGVG